MRNVCYLLLQVQHCACKFRCLISAVVNSRLANLLDNMCELYIAAKNIKTLFQHGILCVVRCCKIKSVFQTLLHNIVCCGEILVDTIFDLRLH